jgi:hypothetical protein
LCRIGVDHIGDLDHLALLHQEADNIYRALGHTVGEFLNGNGLWNNDFAGDLFFGFGLLIAFEALNAALKGCQRTDALFVFASGNAGNRQAATTAIIGARRWLWRHSGAGGKTTTRTANGLAFFFICFKHRGTRAARRDNQTLWSWSFFNFAFAKTTTGFTFRFLFDFIIKATTVIFFSLAGFGGVTFHFFNGFAFAAGFRIDFSVLALNLFPLTRLNEGQRTSVARIFASSVISMNRSEPDSVMSCWRV